jgi:hypothetical protein
VKSRRQSGFRLSQVKEETEDDIFAYNSQIELIESASSVGSEHANSVNKKKRENKRKQSLEKKMIKILALLCTGLRLKIKKLLFYLCKKIKNKNKNKKF